MKKRSRPIALLGRNHEPPAQRAYQVPRSNGSQPYMMPIGNMLSVAMKDQADIDKPEGGFQQILFPHTAGCSTRRQTNVDGNDGNMLSVTYESM
ncbi:MAG: hypothetical protein ACRD3S_01705 [Terracidiphilus sp.]